MGGPMNTVLCFWWPNSQRSCHKTCPLKGLCITIHLFACPVEIHNVSPRSSAQLPVPIVQGGVGGGASLAATCHAAPSSVTAYWVRHQCQTDCVCFWLNCHSSPHSRLTPAGPISITGI